MIGVAHRWILASAGTGKTYQLSGRFLALLFDGVSPERILATTFTRKAAGEILDRVLRRLVEAIDAPARLAELNAQLAEEGRPPVDRARCLALCGALARGLSRVRIRTLDAFFVQLAGVFALELGLPPAWRILEEDEVRGLARDALDDALAHAERPALVELLRALQRTGASRRVEGALLSTVDDCRDAYLDSPAEAWDRVRVPPGLAPERLADVLQALRALPLHFDKRIRTARDKLCDLAEKGDWEQALGSGLLARLSEGKKSYYGKELDETLLALLSALLEHAAHRLLDDLRRQNLAARDWLARFEQAFLARKQRAAGLSFEDVPRALAPSGDAALLEGDFDLGYRLDGRIDHLLLDEFQDTAPPQWRVLAPLAEEIAADHTGARTLFCVGDVKQSIYAWRLGEPRLLSGLGERFPSLPPPTALVESWRSSAVVLKTVDRVFSEISTSAALSKEAAYEAARAFERAYAPHVAARDLPGSASLYEAPLPPEGASAEHAVLAFAADRAAAIAASAPSATIAVLLRRNTHVPRVIDLLRRRGLRASGEGGSPLTDSAAVLHALSALHLADHPGDTAAAFHVATSPLADALGAAGVDPRRPRALSAALRARLSRLGFGGLLAELLAVVEAHPRYGAWDQKRFAQLVDLGFAFERREELRTSAFLDYVRGTKVEDPSSTAIKVMTIHASKGLEFDAVILPELDLGMTLREPAVLRSRPDPEAELSGVSLARRHAVCELDQGGLGAIRREEDVRHVTEALCIFYVALTRAARRLDLIVRHAESEGLRAASYARVLRDRLCGQPSAPLEGEPGLLWRHPRSAERWWPEPREEAPAPLPERRRPRFAAPAAPRETPRRTPSAEEGGRAVRGAELLRARGGALSRGTLIHRFLQEVAWLDAFALDDAALDALARGREADPRARAEAIRAFRAALERAELRVLLTRPEADDAASIEVWRERPFAEILREDGADVLWSGAFDRVVVRRDASGAPLSAEVIDFKTDRVSSAQIEERAAFYRPQIRGYARVLARMTGLQEERVTATLAFLEPGVVRRV